MTELVTNPNSGAEIGIIERHHVESIMSATDMGAEIPDEDDRTLKIWDSYASSPSTELGRLDKAYGFKVISQLTKSLPFGPDKLAGLLFRQDQDLKNMMVESIVKENERQLSNRQVEPRYNPSNNATLESALGSDDGLTPKNADPKITGSWSSLRRR